MDSCIADGVKIQADQRRNLRAPLIVMQVTTEMQNQTFFGYARNISRGGMYIGSINPHDPGSTFTVEFSLPFDKQQTVRCQCEVVWKRVYSKKSSYQPGMGLRFLDLPEKLAQAIDEWVCSNP